MYKKRKHKKSIKIVSISLVVIISFFLCYFALQKRKTLTPLESFFKDGGLLIEKIFLKPFHWISEKQTDQELKVLKEKADSVESLNAKNKELEHQLNELKKTLELNHILSDLSYMNATVINRNMDYWNQMVTIDKGKKNGVKENMPVIISEGLVGFTRNVSNFNSSVMLLTDENFPKKISVKVEIGKQYVYGLLTGYNSKNKTFQMEGIASNIEIPKNSLVTTTGLGEEIPAGIVVGYVKDVTSDNFDLARVVEIESKVNFDAFGYVTIVGKGKS